MKKAVFWNMESGDVEVEYLTPGMVKKYEGAIKVPDDVLYRVHSARIGVGRFGFKDAVNS
jgi:hypothetical protein